MKSITLISEGEDPLTMDVPPIFAGDVRLVRWANSHASGMTSTLSLMDPSIFTVHPLKGFKAATDSEKINGQRFLVVMASKGGEVSEAEPLYRGEAILLWWADDCKDGMKFTLRLREGPDGAGRIHPCDGLPAGKRNGEILQVALWAMEDDETLEDTRAKRKRKRFHELTEIQQSQILCRDKMFQNWLARRLGDMFEVEDRKTISPFLEHDVQKFAEICVRRWCEIDSRAELGWATDEAERARTRWKRLLNAFEEDRWRAVR